jgi:hypothetical protein
MSHRWIFGFAAHCTKEDGEDNGLIEQLTKYAPLVVVKPIYGRTPGYPIDYEVGTEDLLMAEVVANLLLGMPVEFELHLEEL